MNFVENIYYHHTGSAASTFDSEVNRERTDRGVIDVITTAVTDAIIQSEWDANADSYFDHKKAGTANDLIVKPVLLDLINHGKLTEGTFLDLGAGTGWLSNAVAKSESTPDRIIALELSAAMLSKARLTITDPRFEALNASASKIPLPDESVRVIGASDSIDCMADIPDVLAECHRVLEPSGLLTMSIRHPDRNREYAEDSGQPYVEGLGRYSHEIFPGLVVPVTRVYQSVTEWFSQLKGAGFEVETMVAPRAGNHIQAINMEVWRRYNEASGRNSALVIRARKV